MDRKIEAGAIVVDIEDTLAEDPGIVTDDCGGGLYLIKRLDGHLSVRDDSQIVEIRSKVGAR